MAAALLVRPAHVPRSPAARVVARCAHVLALAGVTASSPSQSSGGNGGGRLERGALAAGVLESLALAGSGAGWPSGTGWPAALGRLLTRGAAPARPRGLAPRLQRPASD